MLVFKKSAVFDDFLSCSKQVFSFVSADGDITSFTSDLNDFFGKLVVIHYLHYRERTEDLVFSEYLVANQGVSTSQVRIICSSLEFTHTYSALSSSKLYRRGRSLSLVLRTSLLRASASLSAERGRQLVYRDDVNRSLLSSSRVDQS